MRMLKDETNLWEEQKKNKKVLEKDHTTRTIGSTHFIKINA